jgi:hypothetical protein
MACCSRNLKGNNLLARGCELSDETHSASRLLDRDGITLNSMSAGRTYCRKSAF